MSVCIISNGNMIHNGKLKRSWKLDLEILVNDTDIKIAQDEDDTVMSYVTLMCTLMIE